MPSTPDTPWSVDPEPTNLMVAWPSSAPPDVAATVAMADALDGVVAPGPPAPADEIAWTAVVERDGPPVVVWAEPARPLPAAERASVGIETCAWMLGIETILAPADPLAAYTTLLHALHAAAPASPALLDVNTTRWIRRDERLAWIDGIGPPVDVLWIQQAVARDTGDANPLVWLHTHGLGRCGRPELEMLDVPQPLAPAAADLVDHLAGLCIDEPLPAPDVAWRIGPELTVTLQPWSAITQAHPAGPGGLDHRDDDAHGGTRAVICADAPTGADGALWAWPQDVVTRLARHEAAVYRPARATARRAALAQATWADLVHAVAAAAGSDDRVRVAVEASYDVPGDDDAHEHLWFEATRTDGERAHGRLLSSAQSALAPAAGSDAVIDRADLTDWTVVMTDVRYGPEDAGALRAALATLLESPEPAG